MKKYLKENKFNIIYFCIISIISFTSIFFHEPWRDEAQQWLLVKNKSLFELICSLKYEGHFLLWYLILMPFAKLGFPYITQNIISWFFTTLALFIYMKFLPLPNKIKKSTLFLTPIIYLYSVISRCYCLIPLAIFLTVIFYKDRFKKPILYILSILLLANTHIIMFSMVIFLLLEFFIESIKGKGEREKNENKRIIISFIIMFIGLLISFLPLFGCLTTNKDIGNNFPISIKIFSIFFINPIVLIERLIYPFGDNNIIAYAILISISFLIYYELKYYRKEALKIYIILLWQFFIYGFIYCYSIQRAWAAVFIILFFVWTRKEHKNINVIDEMIRKLAITIFVVIEILCTFVYIYSDYRYNYSSAKQTAEYINENIEKDSVILIGSQEEFACSIIPYLKDNQIYYIQRGKNILYDIQDDIGKENLTREEFDDAIKKFNDKNLYYIYIPYKIKIDSDTKIVKKLKKEGILKKIFKSDIPIQESCEQYIIYKINNN